MTFTVNANQLPGLAEIVSSLPLSLTSTTDAAPQVVGVTGDAGWATRAGAAVADGALAVVVQAPGLAEVADLGTTAARVVLAWDFAANPGVHAAAAEAEPLRDQALLAQGTVRVTGGTDLQGALLDLLVAAGRVFGELSGLAERHRDDVGLFLTGHLVGGAPLSLSVVVTDALPSALHLRLLTTEGSLEALVPSPTTAAPAEVRIVDGQGERLLPTLWVSSRRASWQDAVAVAGGATSNDIDELQRVSGLAPDVWNRT